MYVGRPIYNPQKKKIYIYIQNNSHKGLHVLRSLGNTPLPHTLWSAENNARDVPSIHTPTSYARSIHRINNQNKNPPLQSSEWEREREQYPNAAGAILLKRAVPLDISSPLLSAGAQKRQHRGARDSSVTHHHGGDPSCSLPLACDPSPLSAQKCPCATTMRAATRVHTRSLTGCAAVTSAPSRRCVRACAREFVCALPWSVCEAESCVRRARHVIQRNPPPETRGSGRRLNCL